MNWVKTRLGPEAVHVHGYNHVGLAIAEVKDMLTIAGNYLGQ